MTSTHIYPYVYRGIHPTTGEFYIGMRSANKVQAEKDLGHKYKTSSKIVKPRFDEFEWQVVAEFFTHEAAYDFEQLLIFENMHDIKIVNRACFHEAEARFWFSKHSDDSKLKISIAQRGKTVSSDTRKKLAAAQKGKNHSDDARQKISFAARNQSAETKAARAETHTGRKNTDATIQKMREAALIREHKRRSFAHLQEDQSLVGSAS